MIINPIKFSKVQLTLIEGIKNATGFSSESWNVDEVDTLRKAIREHYAKEQNTTCPYCKIQLKTTHGRSWDVEHIIPRSAVKNFMFEPFNLCVACVECNSAKSDKKVTTSKAKKRYPDKGFTIVHPHFDDYHEHIKAIQVGLFYFPKTDKGEKTIYVCELNRFYSYANFDDSLNDLDDLLITLANALRDTKNEKTKQILREQILQLTIKQSLL